MKSFIEYLQEGSMLAPLALAGSIMAGGIMQIYIRLLLVQNIEELILEIL